MSDGQDEVLVVLSCKQIRFDVAEVFEDLVEGNQVVDHVENGLLEVSHERAAVRPIELMAHAMKFWWGKPFPVLPDAHAGVALFDIH